MRFLNSKWCPICIGIVAMVMILSSLMAPAAPEEPVLPHIASYREYDDWAAPANRDIPTDEKGDLIRYGKELIVNTSKYLGPRGWVAQISNGMNCQNCHLDGGSRAYGNPFSAVASSYPRYRHRSGRIESVEFRINDCMQRSLNGKTLDSNSYEMRAMVAYLNWMGRDVPKDVRPKGGGVAPLQYLERAADPEKGKIIYALKCQRCHGANGEGALIAGANSFTYPPLWGDQSYNVSAGLYRLSSLAGFIKSNMPFGVTADRPELSDEEAWDVAAYISTRERPMVVFPGDWPDISKKPVDAPFGPYADPFSEQQHKLGPFRPIKKAGR